MTPSACCSTRVDGALGVGTQRAVDGHALSGPGVQCGLLTLDALFHCGLGRDAERQRRVEHQPRHLVGVAARIGQRHLGTVADSEQRQRRHIPRAPQPFDVLGGVRIVVCGVAGRDGVGAAGRRGLDDLAEVGDGVVAGLELGLIEHRLAVVEVAAVQRLRHADATAVDRHDRPRLEHVGARPRKPDRQLHRRRQVRSGGHHQWAGVVGCVVGAWREPLRC